MSRKSYDHYEKLDKLFSLVQSARIERDKTGTGHPFEGELNPPRPALDKLIYVLETSDALDVLERELAL